ncbi:hypothetical protein APED_01245 [Acanthopleuribacter pedis]
MGEVLTIAESMMRARDNTLDDLEEGYAGFGFFNERTGMYNLPYTEVFSSQIDRLLELMGLPRRCDTDMVKKVTRTINRCAKELRMQFTHVKINDQRLVRENLLEEKKDYPLEDTDAYSIIMREVEESYEAFHGHSSRLNSLLNKTKDINKFLSFLEKHPSMFNEAAQFELLADKQSLDGDTERYNEILTFFNRHSDYVGRDFVISAVSCIATDERCKDTKLKPVLEMILVKNIPEKAFASCEYKNDLREIFNWTDSQALKDKIRRNMFE